MVSTITSPQFLQSQNLAPATNQDLGLERRARRRQERLQLRQQKGLTVNWLWSGFVCREEKGQPSSSALLPISHAVVVGDVSRAIS